MIAIVDHAKLRLLPGYRLKQSRLGGGDTRTLIDAVVATTIYDDLPRPAKLPPPNFRINAGNEAARIAFQKIWDGENVELLWLLTRGVDTSMKIRVSANLIGSNDDNGDFQGRDLMVATIEERKSCSSLQMAMYHSPIDQEFGEALPNASLRKLAHRMVYYVLRAHGARLHAQEPQMTQELFFVFNRMFAEDFAMILDNRILMADVKKTGSPTFPDAFGVTEELVADSLIAVGKFDEAAKLYQLLSETHFPQARRGKHLTMLTKGAMCLKSAGQLSRAEKVALRALYLYQEFCRSPPPPPDDFDGSFRSFDLQSQAAFIIVWHLLDAATALHKLDRESTGIVQLGDTNSGGPDVYVIFFALLYVAGYRSECDGKPHPAVSEIGHANVRNVLKRAYRNSRNNALEAIKRALENPGKHHFHQVVRSCAQPGSRFQLFCPENRRGTKTLRRETKQHTQEYINECSCVKCSNPYRPGVTMMLCKCKVVAYCDKSCQICDWDEHKHTCTYHLEKKEAKTEAVASRN